MRKFTQNHVHINWWQFPVLKKISWLLSCSHSHCESSPCCQCWITARFCPYGSFPWTLPYLLQTTCHRENLELWLIKPGSSGRGAPKSWSVQMSHSFLPVAKFQYGRAKDSLPIRRCKGQKCFSRESAAKERERKGLLQAVWLDISLNIQLFILHFNYLHFTVPFQLLPQDCGIKSV